MSDPQSITTHGGVEEFYGAQSGAGGRQGFYGVAPTERQTLTQQTGTQTTTQLRSELTALQNALVSLGLIEVS